MPVDFWAACAEGIARECPGWRLLPPDDLPANGDRYFWIGNWTTTAQLNNHLSEIWSDEGTADATARTRAAPGVDLSLASPGFRPERAWEHRVLGSAWPSGHRACVMRRVEASVVTLAEGVGGRVHSADRTWSCGHRHWGGDHCTVCAVFKRQVTS